MDVKIMYFTLFKTFLQNRTYHIYDKCASLLFLIVAYLNLEEGFRMKIELYNYQSCLAGDSLFFLLSPFRQVGL